MKSVLSIKIEKSLIQRIKEFCQDHGLKQGFFVEKALKAQIEREELAEDIIELKELRPFEKNAVSFDDYLKKRKM
jgi:predicted transcriptional regulator